MCKRTVLHTWKIKRCEEAKGKKTKRNGKIRRRKESITKIRRKEKKRISEGLVSETNNNKTKQKEKEKKCGTLLELHATEVPKKRRLSLTLVEL